MSGFLRVAETHAACDVLGPGTRFVVWVQGCGIGCRDCVSPQWIPFRGGREVAVRELAGQIADSGAAGLTLSGGEPFAQAGPLAALVEEVRGRRDLSVMSYTGYTIEHLLAHGTAGQRRLLALVDILVDGPYLVARQADLLWRGSSNQRLHLLSERHAEVREHPDRSAGLQFEVGTDATVRWLGVPPVAGLRGRLEHHLGLVPVQAANRPEEFNP
jgi:anaerobic ribonucleoside-triphosphate reductase activating protein